MSTKARRYSECQIAGARVSVNNIFVYYKQINEVMDEFLRRFRSGSAASKTDLSSSARLTVLCAPSGTGKTATIERIMNGLNDNSLGHRVLHVPLPPQCAIKAMTAEFLRALQDPLADRSSTTARNTARIVQRVQEGRFKLIVIDEFQHLLDRDSNRIASISTDWLKSMLDRAGVPVMCVGLPETLTILRSNEQLERRMTKIIRMNPMKWDGEEGAAEIRYFLREFERQLPLLTEPSDLHEPQLARAIFQATGGLVGRVAQLLAEALEASMLRLDGPDCITSADLAKAFSGLEFDKMNPFNGKQGKAGHQGSLAVVNPKAGPRESAGPVAI